MRRTTPNRAAARWTVGVSALALTAVLVLGATTASAADADQSKDANTVGEVVVTAQFREQSLQQTPIAITAVNAKMLDQRSEHSIYQVAAQAPNVTLKPAGAAFGSALVGYIRGVGQLDFNFALEPGVGMYVDDVYYATLTGSVVDLLDLDHVEISRGPQGTLAGKNSIGGAIKLYSKKPNGDSGGYFEGTYGSLNRIDARGSADFAIVPDKLFVRISGVTRHHDGYVSRIDYACSHPGSGLPTYTVGNGCKLGTEGGQDFSAARIALRWLPTEKVEVNILADATDDNSEVQASTITFANNPNPGVALNGVPYDSRFVPTNPYVTYSTFTNPGGTFANPFGGPPIVKAAYSIPPINAMKEWGVSGDVNFQLADKLSLRSITAYRRFSGDFAEDTDGSPLMLELVMNHVTHNQLTQELRLNGTLLDKLDYTVGGFYLRSSSRDSNRVDIPYVPGVGPFFDFLGNDPVLAHSKSVFAHGIFHVTDKFEIAGGARYSKEDKSYTFSRTNPDGTPNIILGGLSGVTGTYSGSYWDYRADADYHFTSDLMGYLQFSTGTKGGGINPRPFTPAQVGAFGPEKLYAYEAGVKSQLFDHRMRLNLAAFYNDYKDIQLTLLACPAAPCAKPFNAGEAHVKGVEAETEIHPVGGLEFDGSVSYLDFQYVSLLPGVSGPGGVQLGMVTPYTPKWKWSFGVQYEIPAGDKGSLTPRLDASYQSSVFTNAVNGPANAINAYTIFNGRLTWRSAVDNWETSLEVTNLANKYYKLTVFDLSSIGAGFTNAQPGMPREWAVTVKKSF